MSDLPPLVLIGGAPGVGKSTLGERLARELRLPFFSKDGFKEALYDAFQPPDRVASKLLGSPAYVMMYCALDKLLAAGVGAVVESNFMRGLSEPELRPVVARTRAAMVLCYTTPALAGRRYRERLERGERHPGHHDGVDIGQLIACMPDLSAYEVDLDVPTLRVDTTNVDTTDGYAPGFEQIVAFARTEAGSR